MLRHICFLSLFIFTVCFQSLAFAESYQLRVMAYNINGLPWPLAKNKKPLFLEIARLINEQKRAGTAPHVILLQEGFRGDTKDLVAALAKNYPYVVKGPKDSDQNPMDSKNGGAIIGSGLWILSQYPIIKSDKIAYGARCTGSDCYANKGVAYAQIQIPGVGPIDFFTTHMNSKKSSGSSDAKVWAAQRQQIETAKYFFDKIQNPKIPVIFAGDFNIKTNSQTYMDLAKALPLYSAGLFCANYGYYCKIGENTPTDDLHISPDQHFYRETPTFYLNPIYAAKSMRQKLGTRDLSDHLAYVVHYRFDRK